ncbi:hypothetical protein AB0G48_17995 [Streptomyces rubiginosohelvolus]|uniref:hypothetical protein n=1 Tax=Streptomyces rubiginosohelvolus TaxID=67362 RepID=UPI0034069A36
MNTLQHAFDLAVRGLLTELPAQLVTALVAAAATACMRARKKNRATTGSEDERDNL